MTKTVEIDIAGRKRSLRLDIRAARVFAELTKDEEHPRGISILRGEIDAIDEDIGPKLLLACLQHEDSSLTLDDVIEGLTFPQLLDHINTITQLLADFFPTPEKEASPQAVPLDPQTETP